MEGEHQNTGWIDSWRTLGLDKQLLIFLGGVYFLGIVVENVFLGQRGIPTLELARTRYLATGFLFVSFIAPVMWPLHSLWQAVLSRKGSVREAAKKNISVAFLAYAILFILQIALIWSDYGSLGPWDVLGRAIDPNYGWIMFLGYSLALYIIGLVFILIVASVQTKLAKQSTTNDRRYSPSIGEFMLHFLLLLLALLLYIEFIAETIPSSLGGMSGTWVVQAVTNNPLVKDEAYFVFILERVSDDYIFYRQRKDDEGHTQYFMVPTSQIDGMIIGQYR